MGLKKSLVLLGMCGCFFAVSGCMDVKEQLKHDRGTQMERKDYEDLMANQPFPEPTPEAPIPDLESYVSDPETNKRVMPLVTVSVNQTVALRDLLFELADQAGYDIELDPRIRGSLIFSARQRPFDEVVKRICAMAGLRYSLENDIFRVELDTQYTKTYNLSFLSATREFSSSMDYSTTSSADENSAETGSDASINLDVSSDPWAEIELNVAEILRTTDTTLTLASSSNPVSRLSSRRAGPAQTPIRNTSAGNSSGSGTGSGSTGGTTPAADDPLGISGESGTVDDTGAVVPENSGPPNIIVQAPTGEEEIREEEDSSFSINRTNGFITVFARERQHKIIEEYLNNVRASLTTQVLIEAKVLEISLSDLYSAGIDWDQFGGNLFGAGGDIIEAAFGNVDFGLPAGANATGATIGAVLDTNNLSFAANALSEFGTVRSLSSPRVSVLNNQTSLLSVVTKTVYFETTFEPATFDPDTGNLLTPAQLDTDPVTVPVGLLINVTPSIDVDSDEITLALRPTITREVDTVVDPGIAYNCAVSSAVGCPTVTIPVFASKEIDSVVKVKSGQVMVMGGLMEDKNSVEEISVPVLGDIPMLGNLFKSHQDIIEKTEYVILIKATIIPSQYYHEMDKKLYRKLGDNRPFRM